MTQPNLLRARVDAMNTLCEGVIGIDLVPAEHDARWPATEPGAHIDVHLAKLVESVEFAFTMTE